jgi:uncharacterized membrane protein
VTAEGVTPAGPTGVEGLASATETARIESGIARLLVVGTYVAIAFVLVGVVLMLRAGIDPLVHEAAPAFDLSSIPAQLGALQPEGFLWAGLVTVLCLPVARVVVAGVGFARAGDRRLAVVSLLVVLVIVLSILAARGLEG